MSENSAAPGVETVEQVVRHQLSKALGGVRGMAEAAVPTITFTVTYVAVDRVRLALVLGIVFALVLLLVRLVQRQTPQFVINSLVGIAIAAVFVLRSGDARDAFLPGILYNGAYAVVLVGTILIGWPLLGFIIGGVTGDPTGWHRDRQVVRLCGRLTWLLAIPCVLRVVVQYPLWAGDLVGWLGTAKVAMGWPLQVAAFAAMAYLLGRNHTPVTDG